MALGVPTAPTPMVAANSDVTMVSGSFTPAANALLFAHLAMRSTLAIPGPTVAGGGLTWTLTVDRSFEGAVTTRLRQRVYVAATGPAPSAMTVTMTSDGNGRTSLQLLQLPGTTAIPTNFATGLTAGIDDSGGDPSSTLPTAPAATSTLVAFFAATVGTAVPVPPPPGFTEVEDAFSAEGAMEMQSSYDPGSGAVTNAWVTTTGGGPAVGNVLEVLQPAAGAAARTLAMWS